MKNIKDVLTMYFMMDEDLNKLSKKNNIPLEQLAELKAHTVQDTEEGKEIYNVIIEILKQEII